MSRRDLWLGTTFGAGALLTGTAYVCGGPLRLFGSLPDQGPEWLLGLFAATGTVAAFGVGLWRSRSIRPLRRIASGLAWAAVWCVLVASPVLVRLADLWLLVRGLPTPAASEMSVSIDPVRGDREEDYVVSLTPLDSPAELVRFYGAEMERRGWKTEPARLEEAQRFHDARLNGQTNVRFVRGWRECVLRINVYSPGNEPRVNLMLLSPER
jgi:hypothetical protein